MTNQANLLISSAKRAPERVAISFDGTDIHYGDLMGFAFGAADALQSAGVNAGDRVAIWLENDPAFAAAMYGAWLLGAVVVPIHAALTEPEARHILTDSGASVVVTRHTHRDVAESLRPGKVVDISTLPPTGSVRDAPDAELALIQYTAGTSGVPKGAMLTHDNLQANIDQMREVPIAIGHEDVSLCFLPLFHIYGLNVVLNLSIGVGAKIVLSERFDPKHAVDDIKKHGVTVVAAAPAAYVSWLNTDTAPDAFSNVRAAISGAAALPKEVLDGFGERFGVTIWEGYGLTETSPALTSTSIGGVPKANCVGRPLPGVELKLVDADGEEVEDEGDTGEIVVRGPNVFSGYWNKPGEAAFTDDGFFRTGDVGVFDDDGDLYIVDRRRDMVIVSGFNVYPREVEDVLRRHPKVGDVAVVGVPDDHTGERVRAIVVADPPGEAVTADELVEFCKANLAPYKIPKDIDITTEIPRNAAGKVLRRALRT